MVIQMETSNNENDWLEGTPEEERMLAIKDMERFTSKFRNVQGKS